MRTISQLGAMALLMAVSAAHGADVIRDFETKSLSGLRVSGNAPVVDGSIRRFGSYAMKTVLDRNSSNISYRTEVRVIAPDPIKGEDYWYGFSVYLPPDFVPDPLSWWETVAQWLSNPESGDNPPGPPLSLHTNRGEWSIDSRWSGVRVMKKSSSSGLRTYKLGKYATGRWTDWVFHIKWSYSSDGVLEAWKDGVKVVSAKGPNTYNDEKMPFFKMGLYKGWKSGMPSAVKRRVLYHDQFRMVGPGGSYAAVAPGTNPKALKAPSQLTIE